MISNQLLFLTTPSNTVTTSTETQQAQMIESDLYLGAGIDGFFLLTITVILAFFELLK